MLFVHSPMWLHQMKASIRVSSNTHGFQYLHCNLSGLIKQGRGLRSIHSHPNQHWQVSESPWGIKLIHLANLQHAVFSKGPKNPVDSMNNECILWLSRALLHKAGGSVETPSVSPWARGEAWPVSNRGLTDPEPSAAVTL